MRTTFQPAKPQWYLVDAKDKVLGRLSTRIAVVLRGRNTPNFTPHQPIGNHVVVINAEKIKVLGASKPLAKLYYRHSGYLGNLKSTSLKELMAKDPTQIIERAVKGMLPKNQSRPHILKNLHVFQGEQHRFEAQKPLPFPTL